MTSRLTPALTRLFHGLPVAAVLAIDGRIVGFNPAAELLYQRLEADALGAGFVELLFDPDDRSGIASVLAGELPEPESGTWRVRRGDGVLLVSTFHLERLDGDLVAWIATDTLDQGHAEEERALLLSAEHAARAEAEAARFRLNVLSAASSAMTSTLDRRLLLERVAEALVPAVGDLFVAELIDAEGHVSLVHVGHQDELLAKELTEVILRQPIDRGGDDPLATVLRGGEAQRYDGRDRTDAAVASMARDDEQARFYAGLGLRATVLAPVRSAGTTLGVLALSTVERPLLADDLAMVTEVAHRLALALGNVEAYLDERRRGEVLQLSLLPTIPVVDGLEVAVRYLAATDGSKVGGDWYDVIPLGEGQVDLVIGDVVGHDEHAAVEMSQARNALRAFACAEGATPAATLTGLDHMSSRLGMELATSVVARADLHADTLTWSNAGHPPPLLVADGVVTVLDDHLGAMLGIGAPSERRQRTVPFPVGSTLVLYTDGAIEDPEITLEAGLARLTGAVQTASEDGTEAICDAIVASTLDDGLDRRDDIAILVVSRVAER